MWYSLVVWVFSHVVFGFLALVLFAICLAALAYALGAAMAAMRKGKYNTSKAVTALDVAGVFVTAIALVVMPVIVLYCTGRLG